MELPKRARTVNWESGVLTLDGEKQFEVPELTVEIMEQLAGYTLVGFHVKSYPVTDELLAPFAGHKSMANFGVSQEQAARKLGKSRSALANSLRLLSLPETVLELLKSGFITIGHAKVVLGLPTPELQEEAAQMIADNQLNVRQAEALCKKLAKPTKEPVAAPLPSALPVEVEESLKQALGSEVRVAYHDGKGKLTVHFYSDDQLKAFANLLGQYSVE